MYVFVDIKIDIQHFVQTILHNFHHPTNGSEGDNSFLQKPKKIALVSTIQFANSLQDAKPELSRHFEEVFIPQSKPLSPGEILGCTSPRLQNLNLDALIYVGDGRFHLESIMISNPDLPAYKYDPYTKVLSVEKYNFNELHNLRRSAILAAQKSTGTVGIILGTLGRQGSPKILQDLKQTLQAKSRSYIILLLSEIFPAKLDLFPDVEVWIQIACPRLSIDWGYAFSKPLLNPYEAEVAFGDKPYQPIYPMDYYAKVKY